MLGNKEYNYLPFNFVIEIFSKVKTQEYDSSTMMVMIMVMMLVMGDEGSEEVTLISTTTLGEILDPSIK